MQHWLILSWIYVSVWIWSQRALMCTSAATHYSMFSCIWCGTDTPRWEQHFICSCLQCADITCPNATPVLQEDSAMQLKQWIATCGFPKFIYMSSSKRITWTVNTQFCQCHYLMKACSQNHQSDNNSHNVGGIYLGSIARKDLFSSLLFSFSYENHL